MGSSSSPCSSAAASSGFPTTRASRTRRSRGSHWKSSSAFRPSQIGHGFWHTVIYRLKASWRIGRAGQMRQVSGSVRLRGKGIVVFTFATLVLFAMPSSAAAVSGRYTVTALVSNNGVPGTPVDARLLNAWGLVAGPGTPWWVSDNGADFSTLSNATGVKRNLNVSVDGAPTGIVFNGDSTSFRAGPSNAGALFIFATEGRTTARWNPSLGTAAGVKVDSSGAGAIYKGLAIATTATGPQLYATDFHNARIDVFDTTSAAVQTAGGFPDALVPR